MNPLSRLSLHRRRRPAAPAPRVARASGFAAVALTLSLAAAACDTSPVAASVNGVQIKQTALNSQLRLTTANRPYVEAFDRQAASQGQDLSIVGDAPQTLSTAYVSGVLTSMIDALAVHQHLVATGAEPSAAQRRASRSVDEAELQQLWFGFPEAYRDTQSLADAERASVVDNVPPAVVPIIQQVYGQYSRYFFASVCVRTIDVAVSNDGTTDRTASDIRAQQVVADFNDPGRTKPQGGQVACYDPAGLEAQGPTLFSTVLALAPGKAAPPVRTSFGDRVVEVDSRTMQPVGDPAVQRAIYVGLEQSQGAVDAGYQAVVAKAHVTVDPQYGMWDQTHLTVQAPSPLGANSGGASGTGAAGGSGSAGSGSAGSAGRGSAGSAGGGSAGSAGSAGGWSAGSAGSGSGAGSSTGP